MIDRLRGWLAEPAADELGLDGVDITIVHRDALRRKAILRRLFEGFYRECRRMDMRYFGDCPGPRIEIGSGASFVKEVLPDVVTSDVKQLPFVDLIAQAEHLPFADHSLRAIYAINVFHHTPDPRAFFHELIRVVRRGGGAVLIEPYYGPVARFLFKRIHATEGFDINVPDWKAANYTGPMTNANQALSYVVFRRDRKILEREFQNLEIVLDRPRTQLLYLLSGGVNFRQLLPDRLAFAAASLDRLLSPLNPILALQHTIRAA